MFAPHTCSVVSSLMKEKKKHFGCVLEVTLIGEMSTSSSFGSTNDLSMKKKHIKTLGRSLHKDKTYRSNEMRYI